MGKRKQILLGFTEADKEVLVKIVKIAQCRNLCGTKGPWKSFVATMDKNSSTLVTDPAKRPWHVLASFLKTMTDIQMIKRIHEWVTYNRSLELLETMEPRLKFTPEEELVRITETHQRFKLDYLFDSYDEGWVRIERGKPGERSTPERMLALDTEMVLCKDGTKQVVRVCLVDRNLKTVIDTLVRPNKSVLDYKSAITGVSAEDLETVTVTQSEVQTHVKSSITPGTILVGHSVHNDLKALRIDYRRVIDTQYIFPIKGRPPSFIPALRDLCKAVFGYDFREDGKPHDCLEDAKLPMKLMLHRLTDGPSLLEMPSKVDETLLSRLLLHNIPVSVTTSDLESLFPKSSCQIQDAAKEGRKHSTHMSKYAVFSNKADADRAFAKLKGFMRIVIAVNSYGFIQYCDDTAGRLQKKVFFSPKLQHRNAGKVVFMVRKMGFDMQRAATSIQELPSIRDNTKREVLGTYEEAEMPKKVIQSKPLGNDKAEFDAVEPLLCIERIGKRNSSEGPFEVTVSGADSGQLKKDERLKRSRPHENVDRSTICRKKQKLGAGKLEILDSVGVKQKGQSKKELENHEIKDLQSCPAQETHDLG